MTYDTYILLGFLVVFVISTVFLCREVKKYYAHEREMARTNDMYISSLSMLSDAGIISAIISGVSLIMTVILWLKYGGLDWVILQVEKLF